MHTEARHADGPDHPACDSYLRRYRFGSIRIRRRDRYPAAYSSRGPAGASFFQDFNEQPRSVAFLAGVSLLAVLSGVALFWLVYGLSRPCRWRSGSSRSGGFSHPSRKTRSSSRRARGIALVLSLAVRLTAGAPLPWLTPSIQRLEAWPCWVQPRAPARRLIRDRPEGRAHQQGRSTRRSKQ